MWPPQQNQEIDKKELINRFEIGKGEKEKKAYMSIDKKTLINKYIKNAFEQALLMLNDDIDNGTVLNILNEEILISATQAQGIVGLPAKKIHLIPIGDWLQENIIKTKKQNNLSYISKIKYVKKLGDKAVYLPKSDEIHVGNAAFLSKDLLIMSILHELFHRLQNLIFSLYVETKELSEHQAHRYIFRNTNELQRARYEYGQQAVKIHSDKESRAKIIKIMEERRVRLLKLIKQGRTSTHEYKTLLNDHKLDMESLKRINDWNAPIDTPERLLPKVSKNSQSPPKTVAHIRSGLAMPQVDKASATHDESNFEQETLKMAEEKNKQIQRTYQTQKGTTRSFSEVTEQSISGKVKEAAEEITHFIAIANEISQIVLSLFGETGKKVADVIGKGAETLTGIITKAAAGDMLGAVTQAAAAAIQIWGSLFQDSFSYLNMDESIANAQKDILKGTLELENQIATERIRIRKQNGEDVLAAELDLIAKQKKIKTDAINEEFKEKKKNVHSDSVGGFIRSIFGLYDPIEQGRLDALNEQHQTALQAAEEATANQEAEARKESAEREQRLRREKQDRAQQDNITKAQLTPDKMDDIAANEAKAKTDIERRYADLRKNLEDAQAGDAQSFLDLEQQKANELALLTKNTAEQTRAALSETEREKQTIYFESEEARIQLEENGFNKELLLMEMNKDKQIALLDAEMLKYTEDSEAYKKLAQEKAHAEEIANKQIQDARDATEKKRQEQLRNLENDISGLQAQLTEGSVDDVVAQTQRTQSDLRHAEEAERAQAMLDYNHNYEQQQAVLTAISQKYDLQRAVNAKEANKQVIDAMKNDRQAAFEAEKAPLERAIQLEQRRLAEIEKQTKQIEKRIQKEEESRKKSLKEFDSKDIGIFATLVNNVDYESELNQGLAEIANTEGVSVESFSAQSADEAIKERIALMDLENENKYKLEEITRQAYLAKQQQIAALQARYAQEALQGDDLSNRERLELGQMQADAYTRFQDAHRNSIDDNFDAQVQRLQEQLEVEQKNASDIQDIIEGHQIEMGLLTQAYEEDIYEIENGIQTVIDANATWGQSVEQLSKRMEGPMKKITTMFKDAVKAMTSTDSGEDYHSKLRDADLENAPDRNPKQYGIYVINGGDGYYYKSTSDMLRYQRMATGGVVPAGFPNDTYPALLSSGEAVLPVWFTQLLANAQRTLQPGGAIYDQSKRVQITLQGVFNEPGMVRREIMQALQQANYAGAGVNGTYYMNTGLN